MNQPKNSLHYSLLLAAAVLLVLVARAPQLRSQQTAASPTASSSEKPYLVEWVYKVKWGHADEFWQIFKKYQIPVLNRERKRREARDACDFNPVSSSCTGKIAEFSRIRGCY